MPFNPQQKNNNSNNLFDQYPLMASMGGIGAGLGSLFGGNPASGMGQYFDQMSDLQHQYLNPYVNEQNPFTNRYQESMDRLQSGIGNSQGRYENLLNNPGEVISKLGSGYQQSPGYKFALQQALQAGNQSAAAGGMAGSPMAQQNNMATAQGLASKDYGDYMRNEMGLYGSGLEGMNNINNMNYNIGGMNLRGMEGINSRKYDASKSLADNLSSILAQRGKTEMEGNESENEGLSSLFSGLGTIGGYLLGGPLGGAAGGAFSKLFGK